MDQKETGYIEIVSLPWFNRAEGIQKQGEIGILEWNFYLRANNCFHCNNFYYFLIHLQVHFLKSLTFVSAARVSQVVVPIASGYPHPIC